jgi:predicted RNase H-like nuclease (RuvC/YqgF family)
MAKIKNLKKKIRRLEARLEKGAKKLAKLKRKLEEAGSAAAVKPAIALKEPRVGATKKRKLNLTPERRAQLAEAMRARWVAKRAAAAATVQDKSSGPGFSVGDSSQPQ